MKKNRTFIFDSFNFNVKEKTLYLKYSFDDEYYFEEKIEFPSDKKLSNSELEVLNHIFKYLHIACGISYYKLFIPYNIKIKTFDLNKEEADFFNNFYLNGLGEFFYRNNITDFDKHINFPFKQDNSKQPMDFVPQDKKVIAVGGGKDSVVSIEILKKYYSNLELISINSAISIENTMKVANLKSLQIKRTISKNIIELNKKLQEIRGYNGHVPITGILAFIFLAGSIIYDFDTIILSNERSANVGNIEFCGKIINHQWSKSFEFEKQFNEFCKKFIVKNFNYVSFLRPLSEIHIAKLFSRYKQYHKIFTSCNKAFKIENRIENWCCNCDKCRFVFLILSVFIAKEDLINIFGKNLFEDETQLNGYRELCGLDNFKPFECVGEIDECIYAILKTRDEFKNDYIVKEIRKNLNNINVDVLEKQLFELKMEENFLSADLKINLCRSI
jgi:7-cyano-7-deazaguanine synthase in queuosine biosynthesis